MRERVNGFGESQPTPRRKAAQRPLPRLDQVLFNIFDIVALGGPSRNGVYRLIASGRLKTVKIGRRNFIDGDSLRALLRDGTPVVTAKSPAPITNGSRRERVRD